jgi:hypothetical protein
MKANSGDVSVPGLRRLARTNAATTRRTYAALGEALVGDGTADVTLTDWQRSILLQLLRQVIGDIYGSLRWLVLAEMEDGLDTGLGSLSNLSADSEARVFSLMSQRGLLTDVALIEAITHRLNQHQLEQATRPPDRNRWTNEPVLDNPADFFGQPLPEFSPVNRRIAAYVIDRSRRTDRYGNPVLVSSEIETPLYERLHWRVAAVLRHMLVDEFGDNLDLLDARIETASVETIRHSLAIAAAPTSSAEAARALESSGLLHIETVYRLLKAGEIPLFEECFARLAGIRPVLLRRLVYEAGGECFAVLARALDVDFDLALSVFTLTRSGCMNHVREGNGGDDPLKAIYDTVSFEDANSIRTHWTRQPDFASALWEAETGPREDPLNTLH